MVLRDFRKVRFRYVSDTPYSGGNEPSQVRVAEGRAALAPFRHVPHSLHFSEIRLPCITKKSTMSRLATIPPRATGERPDIHILLGGSIDVHFLGQKSEALRRHVAAQLPPHRRVRRRIDAGWHAPRPGQQ